MFESIEFFYSRTSFIEQSKHPLPNETYILDDHWWQLGSERKQNSICPQEQRMKNEATALRALLSYAAGIGIRLVNF